MKRAEKLYFKGKKGPDGQPLEYFAGVPARTLEEGDIARLGDEQYKEITGVGPGGKRLYVPKDDDGDGVPEAARAESPAAKTAPTRDRAKERERGRAARGATNSAKAAKAHEVSATETTPPAAQPDADPAVVDGAAEPAE